VLTRAEDFDVVEFHAGSAAGGAKPRRWHATDR
jgi:hypothetical protein